ncbi:MULTISPECIES: hypothetical protein [unclassified Rhizobium]|uniref:hypothetical protein n=1 Tax=unclassified Rhizobium TaxID=2613769 RepID=UPI0007F142C1|nr:MULTISPECIES: hypothetical protein [unclassified Rhizobium]ANM14053.1 hypothetical protein AMK05_PD00152 [Rhizobium sp. N324]ANM20433.1 hypothetical protein AMK06_PD00154 [Rhizobium sp. N541]ANM26817.1 hypothetical protein AMK07_PD00154 [Rhizobium sp. N941]OYD00222.1 hypothetical protein AMK08_PD00152 [Rhizobium sp. N4311]
MTTSDNADLRSFFGGYFHQDWAMAFTHFGAIDPQAMIDEAALRTAGRCADRHILAIQDTTVVRASGGGGLRSMNSF